MQRSKILPYPFTDENPRMSLSKFTLPHDLAKLIIEINKSHSNINYVERPSHDHKRRHPSLLKVKKLGWKSKTDLHKGLKKTLDK